MAWLALGAIVLLIGAVAASLDATAAARYVRPTLIAVLLALGAFFLVRDAALPGVACITAAALIQAFGGGAGAWAAAKLRRPPPVPRRSEVETEWLRMVLDHESGETAGVVRKGRFAGQSLRDLSLAKLTQLLAELDLYDGEGAQLLRAYLRRVFPDAETAEAGEAASSASAMDAAEALVILGVRPEATSDEIIDAHRQLMMKFHPDKGGSDYFASKLNQARDLLLGRAKSA